MSNSNTYFIDDDSCLRIKFNSSAKDDLTVMRYARKKADCPYFRVMKAKKPYTVFRQEFVEATIEYKKSETQLYKLVKVGVIN